MRKLQRTKRWLKKMHHRNFIDLRSGNMGIVAFV